MNMTRQNDLSKKQIADLEKQLAMSGDSIHVINKLQIQVNERDAIIVVLREEVATLQ